MADKKISDLTGATTPLAGTEVLPIVQSGSTVKVSVANLTAGRSVATGALSITTSANNAPLTITDTGLFGAGIRLVGDGATTPNKTIRSNGGQLQIVNSAYGGVPFIFTDGGDFQATGNIKPSTAGKGIDFSANANAPGMTSELLTWYEEGTWTATLTDGTNNATMSANLGRYTRIGRAVFVCGNVSTSSLGSVTGNIKIAGLPFAIATFAGGTVTYAINLNLTAGYNVTLLANNSGTELLPFVWDAATGTTWMQASEWTNTGNISFSAMYFV